MASKFAFGIELQLNLNRIPEALIGVFHKHRITNFSLKYNVLNMFLYTMPYLFMYQLHIIYNYYNTDSVSTKMLSLTGEATMQFLKPLKVLLEYAQTELILCTGIYAACPDGILSQGL